MLKIDKNSGWNRILNVNPGSDSGFYILDGANWYPSGRGTPTSPTFPANEWHSLTISTGPDQNAAAYLDGGSKAEWLPHGEWSTACRIVTSSFDVMMFFNDGGSISCISGGEHTGLHVKSIQVFNERLTDSEVAQLEVDNPVFPAVPVIVNVNDAYPQNQYVSSYCPSGKTYSRHACGSNAQASLTSGATPQYGPFNTDQLLQSGGHCSCCCNCHTVWVECQ